MSNLPRAAFVDDNPVMAGAFSSFINWLWSQPGAHEAHCEATGTPKLSIARTAIGNMVDDATGRAARPMRNPSCDGQLKPNGG
jgi:hypothetical protein